MTTTDPFAPAKQVQQLARVADSASTMVFGYILEHPKDPDLELWRRMMRDLDRAAAALDAQALQLMGALNAESLAEIKEATAVAESFTQKTAELKRGLKVFAGILNLAGALLSGAGLGTIIDAARSIRDTAKDDNEKGNGKGEKGKDAAKPATSNVAKPPKV